MSRLRHITKSFALLACLTFLFFSFGCSGDSVVAPANGPEGAKTGSDGISTPEGDPIVLSEFGGVGG